QAVVQKNDYRENQSFEIINGPHWDEILRFQCNGEGRKIPFPYWNFEYINEDVLRRLYTRDNQINTTVTYHWPGNEKLCEESYIIVSNGDVIEKGDAIQSGFAVD
ncbi:MAG: hypothetical protein ABEI86_08225, partial [Halobacteriaceae archaeon]